MEENEKKKMDLDNLLGIFFFFKWNMMKPYKWLNAWWLNPPGV